MLALEGDPVSLNACKTMHLMHAWLLYVKMAGFSGFFKRTTEAEPDWGIRARSYWCCYHCHFEQNKSG